MKNLACCFILLLCPYFAFSQPNPKLDSLKKVLMKLPKEGVSFGGDTMRVKVLCEMGEAIIERDTCIVYFEKSIAIAQKLGYSYGLSRGYNGKAYRFKNQKKYLQAQDIFYKASFYAEKSNNFIELARSYQGIADINLISAQSEKAFLYYSRTVKIYEKLKNYRGILICNNNMAILNENIGNIPQTINLYNKCLSLNKNYQVDGFDGHIYNNLAFLYQKLKNYPEALKNVKKAIGIYKKSGDFYKIYMASTYIIWADIAFENENLVDANKYAQIALNLNNGSGVNNDLKIYKLLQGIAKKENKFRTALFYFEKIKRIDDTLNKQTYLQQLNSTKFEYQNLQQQDRLSLQTQEISNKNQIQILLAVVLLIVLFFGFFLLKNNSMLKKQNIAIERQAIIIADSKITLEKLNESLERRVIERTKELSIANTELKTKNKEITEALFKGQSIERKRVATELHDNLGSTLSAIKWRLEAISGESFTEKEKKVYSGILEMMQNAYSEVRNISHNLLPAQFEKYGMIGALQKLISGINENQKINVILNADAGVSKLDKSISLEIYNIIMELLNNVFKYSQANLVSINFTETDTHLLISVKDNGIGIDTNKHKDSGIGFKNIQDRLYTIDGLFEIISKDGEGTEIVLTIRNVFGTKR